MGLFSLFKKNEPPLTLKIGDVAQWLHSYQEEQGLDRHFSTFVTEMNHLSKRAYEKIEMLEHAKLLNAHINPRAVQIMEGHRKQFIKRVTYFLEQISIPKEYKHLSAFAESFSEDLEKLNLDTQKSTFVLNEFFEKETAEVAKIIKEMDKSIISLRNTFETLNNNKIDMVYTKLEAYLSIMEKREGLKRALHEEQNKLEEPQTKLSKITQKIEELKNSQGNMLLAATESELQEIASAQHKIREEIHKVSMPITKALQKYSYQKEDAHLRHYTENFAEGLFDDSDNTIIKHFTELQKELMNHDLNEKQREKAEKAIEKMNASWLDEQRKSHLILLQRKELLQNRLQQDTTRLHTLEQQRWKKATEERIAEIQKNVDMIENELERLSPPLYAQKIRDALRAIKPNINLEV
jgi:hypothetical protein